MKQESSDTKKSGQKTPERDSQQKPGRGTGGAAGTERDRDSSREDSSRSDKRRE